MDVCTFCDSPGDKVINGKPICEVCSRIFEGKKNAFIKAKLDIQIKKVQAELDFLINMKEILV